MTEQIEATMTIPPYIEMRESVEGSPVIRFRWFRPFQGFLAFFMLLVFLGSIAYLLSQWSQFKPEFIESFAIGLAIIFLLLFGFALRIILNTTTIELADYAILIKTRPFSRWQTVFIPVDDIQSFNLGQTGENTMPPKITATLNSGETIPIGTEFYTVEELQFVYQYITAHYGLTA